MKTPEEMAEEWGNVQPLISFDDQNREQLQKAYECSRKNYAKSFLAGYAAAQTNSPTPAKWISVFTKTPPIENDADLTLKFLTIDKYGNMDVLFWTSDNWEFMNVTHWMPLPEPPKKEE